MMAIDRCSAKIKKKEEKIREVKQPVEWVDTMKSCNKKNSYKVIFFKYPL